ncbi:MAG: hypothetical protein AAF432_14535 [Planctomycetota bacterium]
MNHSHANRLALHSWAWFIGLSLVVVTNVGGSDQATQSSGTTTTDRHARHDRYETCVIATFPSSESDSRVLVDGKVLPVQIEYRFNYQPSWVDEPHRSMRFVLIAGDTVNIIGDHEEQVLPFYVCQNEVSQAQAAATMGAFRGEGGYASFVRSEFERVTGWPWDSLGCEVDFDNEGHVVFDGDPCDIPENARAVLRYLCDWRRPVFCVGTEFAGGFVEALTVTMDRGNIGIVRLPTISEWTLAESTTRHRAQHEVPDNLADPRERIVASLDLLDRIRPSEPACDTVDAAYDFYGNVSEVVYPSDAERNAINEMYWHALQHDKRVDLEPIYAPSLIAIGGSFTDTSDTCAFSAERSLAFVGSRQRTRQPFFYLTGWSRGIRPVIDVPSGVVTQD